MAVEDMEIDQMRATPAWKRGWEDANNGKNFRPGQMDAYLYGSGFRACEAASGIQVEESKVPVARVWPSDPERHGYEEARDLMAHDPRSDYTGEQKIEYTRGYHRGIMEKVDAGDISINRARELMGFGAPVEFDPVKIPGHYNSGTIEVANFIADQKLDFPRGNVVKYVSRAGKKNPETEIQDLEKAAAYLQMAHNLANGKPAVVRDPVTKEVVWSLFKN